MSDKKNLFSAKVLLGVVVTFLLIVIFGPRMWRGFLHKGLPYFGDMVQSFGDWMGNPTAFVLTYFLAYILLWWKPLAGSALIIVAGILFIVFNTEHLGFILLVVPALAVAVLYLADLKKKPKAGLQDG
jgi:hypothetical protein